MLENNVNKNQIPYQAMQPGDAGQTAIPMQSGIPANPELLKEDIQDTYVANRVANTTDDPKAMMGTAALLLPTWLMLTQSMDVFAKHSRGEYENTLQYKVAKFGDKVADSSVAKSSFMQSIGNGFKSVGKFFKTKILDKNRITRAAMYTPSLPENSMAMAHFIGMEAMQLFDYSNPTESFLKPQNISDLDMYGATKSEIARYKSLYEKCATDVERAALVQRAEFETIQKNTRSLADFNRLARDWATADAKGRARILQDLKAFEWGFNDYAHLKTLTGKTHEYIPEIFEATQKANKKMFARDWGSNRNSFTRFGTKVVGREVYASEFTNKLFAELQYLDLSKPENARYKIAFERTGYINKMPKSAFAKYLNRYLHIITEGATNRVAGGKFIALMQAWFLAEAIYKSAKAEGFSEKAKTFAERFTELIAMFATIPLALKLMHSIGGLQYAGMTKEQVEAYRKRLLAHNEKAMKGGYASKDACNAEIKELKKLRKAGVKNPFVNLAKRIGRIVSVGLEQIRPYDKADIGEVGKDGVKTYRKNIMSKLRDLKRHPKFGLKQMSGYPMRIILGMAILMPFLSKLAVKGSHLIFGKPKHSVLDEDKEQEQKTQNQPDNKNLPPQLQQNYQTQTQPVTPVVYDAQGKSTTNMLNKYKPGQQIAQNSQTVTTTETTINKAGEPVRTYIPSPVGVQITNVEDATSADQAMRRADIAEEKALEALKMN